MQSILFHEYCIHSFKKEDEKQRMHCSEVVLRKVRSGIWKGKVFYTCNHYPHCRNASSISEERIPITKEKTIMIHHIEAYITSLSLIYFHLSYLYFNLDHPLLLDEVLRTDIIRKDKKPVEKGITGARIFYDLYYHLINMPSINIQRYLQYNFPVFYSEFDHGRLPSDNLFRDVTNDNGIINEEKLKKYLM